jgi:hypothetical protein
MSGTREALLYSKLDPSKLQQGGKAWCSGTVMQEV